MKNIKIPYTIFQGDTDIVTSTKYIAKFVEASANDNLKFHLVHNSGHIPSASGMNTILENGLNSFLNVND